MAKKTEKISSKKEIKGTTNNKWSIAIAGNPDDIIELLEADWEPFSVDMGKVYFKKK